MADFKVPVTASKREARSMIRTKLADSKLSVRDRMDIEDQYKEYSFAKGGDVKKQTKKQTAKIAKVMGEFKEGSLHSGKGGPIVKNPKQAIAISLSEAKVAAKATPKKK